MPTPDAVLKLRPTNVAQRLGEPGRVCVLSSRDILRSTAQPGTALLVFELAAPRPLAAGILRAARQLDAVIGLSAPAHPRGEGPGAYAFFHEVAAAGDDAGHELPMFLRGGPVTLWETSEVELAAAREAVFQFVDAGFTQVCVDVAALEAEEAAAALLEVAAPVLERELALEVAVADDSPEGLGALAGRLRAFGVHPEVFSLAPGMAGPGSDLRGLAEAAAPAVVGVGELAPAAVHGSGLRQLALGAFFDEVVFAALAPELRDRIARWRDGSGGALRRALGHFHRDLADLDASACLRIEALAYHEALDLLAAAGSRGTGRAAVDVLAA